MRWKSEDFVLNFGELGKIWSRIKSKISVFNLAWFRVESMNWCNPGAVRY